MLYVSMRSGPAFLLAFAFLIAVGALLALKLGIDEARLALSGPRREVAVETLRQDSAGWVLVRGCVRHDLAVRVSSSGKARALGEAGEDSDHVFTPLASEKECDEATPPSRVFALVEDVDSASTTLGFAYRANVTQPAIVASIDGTIGYGTGSQYRARSARKVLAPSARGADLPLLEKDRRPGALWPAIVTATAGLHGLALLGVGLWWFRRRQRRSAEYLSGARSEIEEDFFRSETLD